ncbi:ACT domain-containing protein [Dermatobacter hominis]|uniref:ACT domain-containing protein n=1 Tax=Dermatobacter hominis TaxID=2884263 RepID=UPI001D1143B8|nr:ACT domain-containing protein [Dermatobacter hominis]UDY36597.1 ACT domain-containing protein [Dermatobacter hominis]
MTGAGAETDLAVMLRTLRPAVRPDDYVVALVPTAGPSPLGGVDVAATIVEDEGTTVVLARAEADRVGLAYDFVGSWITLGVRSSLEAVGLTAAVSTALAARGISCNVLAGFHHDHLLVPVARRDDALAALDALAGT